MNHADMASTLTAALALTTPPVAITFADKAPQGVALPEGKVAAGCRFWQNGAQRALATSSSDHDLCSIGVYTHNLQPSPVQQTDLLDALQVFAQLEYVTPADLAAIPVLRDRASHVVYAPLAETPLPPDVVLLFVDSAQTLILSEATQQVEQQLAPAMGRPACAVVPQVMNSGRAALSLGCCGARAYLDVLQDGIAVFALPGPSLEAYVQRVASLAKANRVLTTFHTLRRQAVEGGAAPTIAESLAALG